MMASPYLVDISDDRVDLSTWHPASLEDVFIPLVIQVAWQGEAGSSLFYTRVMTPEAIRTKFSGAILSDRAMIVVSGFDYRALKKHVEQIVAASNRETIEESCQVLNRYFQWEYEGQC